MAAVGIAAQLEFHADLRLTARTPGEEKPFLEQRSGDSYWHKMAKWMRRIQVVDRRGNRYVKRVEDPRTAEVVRDVNEPLTDHRGFGSARGCGLPGRDPHPRSGTDG
jgi:hypothetical protein